jgi:hypothetical protein
LIPHPSHRAKLPIAGIDVAVALYSPTRLSLRFTVHGQIAKLKIPAERSPTREDGLWQHTCFEAFLREPGNPAYCEYNLSPSGQWAQYRFSAYRAGMSLLPLGVPPAIKTKVAAPTLELVADIDLEPFWDSPIPQPPEIALASVLEEQDGTLTYWALSHPLAKPDFHHADSFAPMLPTDPVGRIQDPRI